MKAKHKNLPTAYKLVAVAQRKQHGDILNLAREFGYSQSHVSNVLTGRRNNPEIVDRAYEMVYDRPTYQDLLKERSM